MSRRACLIALAVPFAAPLAQAQEDPAFVAMDLGIAATACQARDVDSFVEVFIQSDAVRKASSAKGLTLVSTSDSGRAVTTLASDSYADFPLAIFDYYYTTAQGVDDTGYTHVLIEKNLSADNRLRVDWVRVTYDGNSEGGDDPGAIVEQGAEPGSLLFYPTETCWELIQVETTLP